MHKIRIVICALLLLCAAGAGAQKPLCYKLPDYDVTFINLFTIDQSALTLGQQLDSYFRKDTLTGMRALHFALLNELGLRGYTVIDGHRHGTCLDVVLTVIHAGAMGDATGYTRPAPLLKKIKKSKGLSLLIEFTDPDQQKLVWAGWCDLARVKTGTELDKLRHAVRILIEHYPREK